MNDLAQMVAAPPATADLQGLRVAVFGFDLTEAAQIRRIRSLLALGCQVTSFTQRRGNMNDGFRPDWRNVDLGHAPNAGFLRRALLIPVSVLRALRHRQELTAAELVIARNADLALIAILALRLAGRRTPLIYECLDIHGLFTRAGPAGRLMRWAERRILARSALLLVSSPRFLSAYFGPVQGHAGPAAVIENKLALGGAAVARPTLPAGPRSGAPLRLGLVGSIRCAPSFALLCALADRMGPDLQVVFAGVVHSHALPGFHAEIARRPNMVYRGAYAYPDELPEAYAACDLVWAQDLWQRGANSDWLLPNRIYEASWCGCPQIAVAGTETGRRIAEDGLGWVVAEPTPAALEALLRGLTSDQVRARSAALLARDAAAFVQDEAELAEAIARARA